MQNVQIKEVRFGTQPFINTGKEKQLYILHNELVKFENLIIQFIAEHIPEFFEILYVYKINTQILQGELSKQDGKLSKQIVNMLPDNFKNLILKFRKYLNDNTFNTEKTGHLRMQWTLQKSQKDQLDKIKTDFDRKIVNKIKKDKFYLPMKQHNKIKRNYNSNIVYLLNKLKNRMFLNKEQFYKLIFSIDDEKLTPLVKKLNKYNKIDTIYNLIINRRLKILNNYKLDIRIERITIYILKSKNTLKFEENKHFKVWFKVKKDVKIPLTINTQRYKYHKNNLKSFVNNVKEIRYTINKNGRIIIKTTTKEPELEIEPVFNNTYQSIDLNLKHSLIDLTIFEYIEGVKYKLNTFSFDFDQKLYNDLINILKPIDEKGYNNLTNSDRKQLSKQSNKIEYFLKRLISREIYPILNEYNVKQLFMEDLNFQNQKSKLSKNSKLSNRFKDFNINKLLRLFRLGSIKHFQKQILENRNIKVIFVDPKNTSRRCPVCGYTNKSNRKTQEQFKCSNCGYSSNQDTNSTVNIFLKGIRKVFGEKELLTVEFSNTNEISLKISEGSYRPYPSRVFVIR